VILAIGMSAVSLYYYLRVLKYVYVLSPNETAIALPRHVWTRIVVLFCAAITLLLGCLPHLLLKPLTDAIRLSGF
jgi:NADH-quinone oxidoreductase subunit N